MLVWNVRSICNKVNVVMQYIVASGATVACITESWLTDPHNLITFKIKSYGYNVSHTHRENQTGGGVCFIYKSDVNIKKINHNSVYESFEYHCIELSINGSSTSLAMAGIYRKQEISFTLFCTEFRHFCEKVIEQSLKYFLVLGDFNIHCEYDNTQTDFQTLLQLSVFLSMSPRLQILVVTQ